MIIAFTSWSVGTLTIGIKVWGIISLIIKMRTPKTQPAMIERFLRIGIGFLVFNLRNIFLVYLEFNVVPLCNLSVEVQSFIHKERTFIGLLEV